MAGIPISLTADTAPAIAKLNRLKWALTQKEQGKTCKRIAEVWRGRMVRRTPKRWTGQTRRSWKVRALAQNAYELTADPSKVMLWLEQGTKAHGPKKAKRLFIPLTRRAAQAGAKGVVGANKAFFAAKAAGQFGKKKKPPFVMFVDFLWAKKVRGIKAMHIVKEARPQALISLRLAMRERVIEALNS